MGWAISPDAWGKGYATEAAAAAIGWAFDALGWAEVIHCIDAPNTASIAVAERLGSAWLRQAREAGGLAGAVRVGRRRARVRLLPWSSSPGGSRRPIGV